ncbi:MAG TPA: zinc-binding dehydrogenase [Solirubrobacteraceae bacterium]|nr:zinc-binding dehydrogenase [Solirubrobacteraceae bacterium]
MRAAVLAGECDVRICEVPLPEPGPGEVRLALEGCGVCGSDLPVWQGRPWFDYPRPPGAPGHETWGRIDAVGPGVAGVTEGDRVAALSYHGYAEFDLARADRVVALEPGLADAPFPGEALGCAMNVFARSGIRAGDTVAVVGAGFLGCLICQLAERTGARVVALARRPGARTAARAMGAGHALDFDDTTLERVRELTHGELCDVVVEAAGAQPTIDLAGELTRVRGRLVIAGFHQDGPRQIDLQLWNWRGLDVVNAHERDPAIYLRGIAEAAAAVRTGRLDPAPLYGTPFALDELQQAFDMTAGGDEDRPVKAMVCP